MLDGSIASLGSQYVVGLRARNCTTGEVLADDQAQAARKEAVLGVLSQMARRFRRRVGESLATIEKHWTPLEEATTPSLEALKAYSAAWKAIMSVGWVRGQPLFQPAIAIDPDFAMAHAQVGFGYSVMGESALARQSTLKAYQLRDRASDVERFFIETLYDRDVTGNLEREQRTLETWSESYPRDARPHGLISGLALTSTGKYELAIAEADKAIALDPELTPAYVNRAINQLYLNRLDDALLTVRRATERKLESPEWFTLIPYLIAFLKGADDELRRAVTVARKNPLLEDMISHLEALALARSGRLQDARRTSAVPVEIAQTSMRSTVTLARAMCMVSLSVLSPAASVSRRCIGANGQTRPRAACGAENSAPRRGLFRTPRRVFGGDISHAVTPQRGGIGTLHAPRT